MSTNSCPAILNSPNCLLSDYQYGTMGVRDYSVRHASQQQLLETAEPSGPNHYQVNVLLGGVIEDCLDNRRDGLRDFGLHMDTKFLALGLYHAHDTCCDFFRIGVVSIDLMLRRSG